jgi:hypothetical protein
VTEPAAPSVGVVVDAESRGMTWHLELARSLLIPGFLVDGLVRIRGKNAIQARALVVGLVGVEHWRHRVQHADGQGHTSTQVVRTEAEPVREQMVLASPIALGPSELLERRFQLPVPTDGPASLDADDAGKTWVIEAKLDVEDSFDSAVEADVVVAQPTALLRAGAVRLGEYALYEEADASVNKVVATIRLEPMPLVCGEPFSGTPTLTPAGAMNLQEIRAELRIGVEATVSQGERETVTAWSGQLAPEGPLDGGRTIELSGLLPARPLPSIELPHGRAAATIHVILARAFATDIHLVRDVAIATTREV